MMIQKVFLANNAASKQVNLGIDKLPATLTFTHAFLCMDDAD